MTELKNEIAEQLKNVFSLSNNILAIWRPESDACEKFGDEDVRSVMISIYGLTFEQALQEVYEALSPHLVHYFSWYGHRTPYFNDRFLILPENLYVTVKEL